MPRTSERGGPKTRARIAETAAGLFLERGFDAVTVAEVASAAGVSSVTVFNHFPRKEDLFLDRSADASELLRAAVAGRADGVGVLDSLEAELLRLVDERSPLSGLAEHSASFFRTIASSPALVARVREIGGELQRELLEQLLADGRSEGDPELLAAFFVAGYGTVMVATARSLMDGEPVERVADAHRERVRGLFRALRDGVGAVPLRP
jgi:AcrR family transcriptional regulator